MTKILYNLFLFLYSIAIRIAAIWNAKAQKWIEGRKNIFENIPAQLTHSTQPVVWMHCASLGEFEQGRPILEKLQQENNNIKIVLTFFSPSGYEATKNYTGADYIFYLPMDNFFTAKKFIDAIHPSLVLWVKYEYWLYYLQELGRRNIPVLLVSGVFRKNQPFFKWYGVVWKKMLENFTHFFVQNESSKNLLCSIGIKKNITVCGDTRFDRVIQIAQQPLSSDIITAFCNGKTTIVAGSTWEDDEIILAAYSDENNYKQKIILVPHELDKPHLDLIKKMFKKSVLFSEVQKNNLLQNDIAAYNTLIIDTMGMLSRLYQYGDINYIGGGFTGDGIHNILEAAVWGKPIIMGDNYQKYFEAIDLINSNAAQSISDAIELKEVIKDWLEDKTFYAQSSKAAKDYVLANAGATKKIVDFIYVNRLLTN